MNSSSKEHSGSVLVVTTLNLGDLRASRHGIFQRFRALLEAAVATGRRVIVVAPVPESRQSSGPKEYAEHASSEIKEQWHIDVTVHAYLASAGSRLQNGIQSILASLSYRWSPLIQRLKSPESNGVIHDVLKSDIALVVAHRLPSVTLLLGSVRKVPLVFDLDDVEHVKLSRELKDSRKLTRKIINWLYIESIRRAELAAFSASVETLVCSATDADYLKNISGSRFSVLKNAVEIPAMIGEPSGYPIMLMVGMFAYAPNARAAEYFIREVLPLVRRDVPSAQIWFCGAGMDEIAQDLRAAQGTRFLGFVEHIGKIYGRARFSVCPILVGGGTRIKIIEAAAFGLATVSTTIGAEGLDTEDGVNILLADTPDAFARKCVEMLRDDGLAKRLGAAARALAVDRYSKESQMRELVNIFQAACGQHGGNSSLSG